jgi:hypothetical protein
MQQEARYMHQDQYSCILMLSGAQIGLPHVSCSSAAGRTWPTSSANLQPKFIKPYSRLTPLLWRLEDRSKDEHALREVVSIHHQVRSCMMCVPAFTTSALSLRQWISWTMHRSGNGGKPNLDRYMKNTVQLDTLFKHMRFHQPEKV